MLSGCTGRRVAMQPETHFVQNQVGGHDETEERVVRHSVPQVLLAHWHANGQALEIYISGTTETHIEYRR